MKKTVRVKAPTTGETIEIRQKPPTKAEQIEELKAEIETLKEEKAALYARIVEMEQGIEQSRPYLALKRQLEEMTETVERLRGIKLSTGVQKQVAERSKNKGGRPVQISEETREQIRTLREQGHSVRYIASKTNVSTGMVCEIARGKR